MLVREGALQIQLCLNVEFTMAVGRVLSVDVATRLS